MNLLGYKLAGSFAGLVVGVPLVLALTACDTPQQSQAQKAIHTGIAGVTIGHDDVRAVTCWVYSHPTSKEGGISCMPDWMLTGAMRKPAPKAAQ